MAVLKLSKNDIHKNGDDDEKIKLSRSQVSYDSAMVSDWETRNKDSITTINLYRDRIGSGGFMSSDDLTSYRKALDDYVDSSTKLRRISSALGDSSGEDDEEVWKTTIASMESGYTEISDYFSRWKTEGEYKAAVKKSEDDERKLAEDLDALQVELEELVGVQEEYNNRVDTLKKYVLTNDYSFVSKEEVDEAIAYTKAAEEKYGITADYSIDNMVHDKKLYLSDAQRLQEGAKLASASGNADFADYSGYVSTKADNAWSKLTSQYGMGYDDLTYEYINNQNGIRDEIKHSYDNFSRGHGGSDGESMYEEKGYDFIHEDEVAIYNYYYAKEGKEAAQKYLDSIQETLSARKAGNMYANMEDKTLLELAFGVAAGLDQFKSGAKGAWNAITGNDEYIPASATQMASGMVREDLADETLPVWYNFKEGKWEDQVFGRSVGQAAYDTITTTANMLPSIMTSWALSMVNPVAGSAWVTAGQIAGTGMMGVSAAGNAYQEVINLGYDKDQARAYAGLVGASEAGLQYLLGGISKMGGKLSGNAVTKIMNGVDGAFARTAIKLGGNMLSEGLEEGLQEVLTPWFQNLVLHADKDVDWNEVAYSSLLGALTAGFMEGTSTISGEVKTYKTGKNIQESGITAQRLSELGKTFSADTVAYQLAGRVNENTGAYTMGRLFNEIGATLSEQNINEITYALVSKGMDETTARKNAKALAYVVEGGQLSERQVSVIEANDVLAEVARTTLIDANTTWNQRSNGYNEMLKALADEVTSSKATTANTDAVTAVEGQKVAASEGSYEVSVDGQMVNTKTGDTIEPNGLAQAEDGTYKIAVKDADPVANSDVSYADDNQALVYETFVNLEGNYGKTNKVIGNMDLDSRNALLGLYNPEINKDGGVFAKGAVSAFFYGHQGIELNTVPKTSPVWQLSEHQRKIAWNQGRIAGVKATNTAQSNVDTVYEEAKNVLKQTGKTKKGSYHAVLEDGITAMSLNESQKSVYRFADEIAQGVQTNIRVYAGTNKAQGFYNHATDEIWLNLNAANNGREAIMAFTLAHELVHRSKKGSPAKYKAFVEFLMKEYGKQGTDIEALIAEQIAAAEEFNKTVPDSRKVNMTREKALEEVICDACQRMLLDTNAGQKLAEFGAQSKQNKSFLEDLKRWISELMDKLRRYFRDAEPDSKAAKEFAKFDENVKQILADMYVDMATDAGEKLSTIKAAYGGAFAEKFLGIKDIQYNFAAVENHKAKLEKEYSEDSSSDLKTLMARYDKIIDIWTRLGGELNSKFLAEWNSKVGKDRTFTIFKAQAGYKYNVELSSMCKKGVPLFEAIDTIVKQEVMKELGTDVLGKAEKEILYDILKQHHFEIPCAICYVEQARQREGVIIDAFLNGKVDKNAKGETTKVKLGWNQVLDSIQKEMKANGVDYNFAQVSRDIATEKYTPANLGMDEKTQTAFYAALKKIANLEIDRYNKAEGKRKKLLSDVTPAAVKECFKGTLPANLKIFKVLFEEPSSRFKIQNDLLYSSVATQNLSMAHNKLYGLFNSQGGVSGYKTKQGTTIYWGDILGKSWKPDTLRNEGGVRNQSNSDFQMYTLLDQAQMYIDFTAKGYYLQAYTKVLSELKLFGLSRGKINASMIPKVVVYRNADGSVDIEKTMATAGLDENGNPIYDDIEGINHDEAFMLIEDPEYSKSICGICIGYSDAHINKLLDDNRVQQIIGFHDKTDDGSKRYKGARYAKNYNGLNEAVNKEGKTVRIGFNPYVKKAEKKFKFNAETETFDGTVNYNGKTYTADDIPRLASDLYLEMCAKKEYTPAYNDFKDHPNYYKLLADFGLYDSQGHYAPHRKVAYNMPDTVPYLDANGKKQTMKTYDYIKIELEKELAVRDSIAEALADTSDDGIIPQFKAAVKKSQEEKSYSLPKGDQAYMDAIDRGDIVTAQNLVDKAAKAAGYTQKAYHGTGADFTIFSEEKIGGRNVWGKGHYFGTGKGIAHDYATWRESKGGKYRIVSASLKMENPYIPRKSSIGSAQEILDKWFPDMWKDSRDLGLGYIQGKLENDPHDLLQFIADHNKMEIRDVLTSYGYDSIKDGGELVVFTPTQIKSNEPVVWDDNGKVIPLSERFNPENDDIRYSLPKGDPAPTFYSQMARVVDGLKDGKYGSASLLNTLRNRGVKAEEIKWSGIETFLEGKKSVTKAELQEFIAGSMLQIEEEVLDNKDRPYTEDQQKRLDEYEAKQNEVVQRLAAEWKKLTGEEFPIHNAGAGLESSLVNKIIDANKEHKEAAFEGRLLKKLRNDLKEVIENNDDFGFDSWKDALRSIHRHRKDFIKSYEMSVNDKAIIVKYCNALNAYNELPNKISDADTDRLRAIARETDPWTRKIMEVKHEYNEESAKYMTNWKKYSLEGGKNYREMLFRIPGSTYTNEAMFTHWKERSGVLAHARVQDMDTFIGKMLFIEEIQSDWHNAGQKNGYTSEATLARIRELEDQIAQIDSEVDSIDKEYDAFLTRYWEEDLSDDEYTQTVREFQEAKTVLSYERKDIRNELNALTENLGVPDAPFKDTYHEYVLKRLLRMAAEEGYDSIGWTPAAAQMDRWNPNRKTNAQMGITDAKNPDAVAFEEAYRNVYDRRMKKFLSDLGNKWGTSVGKTVLDNGTEVWSMAITDEMKDSVLYEGQVVYSLPKVEAIKPSEEKLEQNIREVADMKSVHTVDASKLSDSGKTIAEIYSEFFTAWGENIHSDIFGDVATKNSSIRSEFRHGSTAAKIASIEAIPRVIKYGKIVGWFEKNNGTLFRIVVAAPITIGKQPYIMGVMLQRDNLYQRLYLHDVIIEEEASGLSQDYLVSTGSSEKNENLFTTSILHKVLNVKRQIKLDQEHMDAEADYVSNKLPIGEDTSPRALLANAFEGIITNDIEKRRIQEYKGKVEMLNAEEQKLRELRAQIKELSFAKGKRDTKKIKDLQFDANQTANRIATLDKMLLGLEASAPLQNILKREKEMAYKRAEQKGKEALEAYKKAERERDQKWQSEVKEKYQASKKKAIETREKREAREKLQKLVLDTVKWITYPTKTDVKCPDILKQPYADFLNGIDLSSMRQANGGDPTKNDLRLANAMGSLATALDKIMISQDPTQAVDKVLDTGYLDLPADFVQKLRDMTENIKAMMVEGDYVVNTMSAEEVRKLSQMIRTLNHAIKTMSNLYANLRFANVEALGFDTMEFMDALGEIEKTSGMKDFVQWDNALPYYAFKRFGNGGESVFEGLMDAQDKLAYLAQEIFDFQEKAWTDKEAKAWSEDTHTIDLPNGNTLTLTTADAMSIYCLSRREQGLQHLLGGGTRVMGIQEGSKKAKDSRSLLTIKDIDAINSSLTDRQRQVAEAIQEFMSTVCSEWGNEISMKRFLTKEFTEKFYFPIESNDENLPVKDPAAQQSDLFRLLNISATKPLTPGANNEVIIRNIFDVFTGHASDMARLNAYGMGLLDYMKWLNYREKAVNEEGQIKVRGVRKSMQQAYGDAAMGYVLNLVKDVNGRASDSGDPHFLMKWMRNAKIASVGANIRVAALQFTAYPRAAMVLSSRSIALGLTKVPQITKAKKYCGIALWKSFGFYDTNIARSIEDQMKGVTNVKQKLIELSMKGAEWGDAITWGALWNACEYEVAKTTKNKVGSEEFYQEVGKKLREVVYSTQVVDSTLTRSQIMRSKSGMTQEAASFMSEPTLTTNILMDAGFQFEAEKRRTGSVKAAWNKTGTHIGRAVAVYSCVALLGALVESLGDAWRDDEDEEFYKKFFEALPENILLNMLPFNKVPIISDVVELALSLFDIGFFSSEKMSTQWLTQTASAVDAWGDVFSGKSTATVYGALYKTVKALSSASGLPVSGAMREVVAMWNNTAGNFNSAWKLRTYGQTQRDLGDSLYDAIISGNDKQEESIMNEFRERSEDEKGYQSSVRSAIRKALRENDPRIKEAAQAVMDGNPPERARIAREIIAEGHFETADIQAAINAEVDKLRKEAKGD